MTTPNKLEIELKKSSTSVYRWNTRIIMEMVRSKTEWKISETTELLIQYWF